MIIIGNITNYKHLSIKLYLVYLPIGDNMRTTIKVGTSGRAQIPMNIRIREHIKEGDILVVDLKEVIHVETEGSRKMEAPA